jgi:hypothetical protein
MLGSFIMFIWNICAYGDNHRQFQREEIEYAEYKSKHKIVDDYGYKGEV